jgi:hypothetical protein
MPVARDLGFGGYYCRGTMGPVFFLGKGIDLNAS